MAVLTIYPYLIDETWVFDDERTSLKEEAFVCGATEMISRLVEVKEISHASRGFAMRFSDEPFGHDAVLTWLRSDDEQLGLAGNWYKGVVAGEEMESWLCPALFLYFQSAPKTIYVKVEQLPDGVNPIWDNDGSEGRRFVGPQ